MKSWIEVHAVDRRTAAVGGRESVVTGLHWFAVARDEETGKTIRHPHHTQLPAPAAEAEFVEYADAGHDVFVSWLEALEGPDGPIVDGALRVARDALARELKPEIVTDTVSAPTSPFDAPEAPTDPADVGEAEDDENDDAQV